MSTRPASLPPRPSDVPAAAPPRAGELGHPARRPPGPEDLALTAATQVWLATLPEHARPEFTGWRHPHVLNRLRALWSSPADMRRYFLELMIDHRGTRRGFSYEVLAELTALQDHYASQLSREQRAVWNGARRPV